MRLIKRVIVHCTATRPDWFVGSNAAQIREIDRWHRQKGWAEIGYHYLVHRDGEWGLGRDEKERGAHTLGHNTDSIGIALVGGHGAAATDDFFQHFTQAQSSRLRDLIKYIEGGYGVVEVHGHNEFAAKGCPGFNVKDWLRSGK